MKLQYLNFKMGKTKGIEVYLRIRPTKKPFSGLGN
jgi:hypothetical protein